MKKHRHSPKNGITDFCRLQVGEFDREFVADTFAAPSPSARRRWLKARRKPGRPKTGRGSKVISVSIEKELLTRSDRLARKMGISRARLIAGSLRIILEAQQT